MQLIWIIRSVLFTCLLGCGALFELAGKLELWEWLSQLSNSFFTGSSIIGPRPCKEAAAAAAAFLATALVRRPVKPVDFTLGVLTTSEEIDLSFLLVGSEIGDATSSALIFFLLNGKSFDLTSCKLWSALKITKSKKQRRLDSTEDKEKKELFYIRVLYAVWVSVSNHTGEIGVYVKLHPQNEMKYGRNIKCSGILYSYGMWKTDNK